MAKRITIALSCFTAGLIPAQEAFAQLNIGRYGVQRGLEFNYLQYQLSGQNLSQMRGIPGCAIGYGLNCNKTGAVLEQLLAARSGPTYQDLLIRAAGGEENYRKFAAFYGNDPHLSQVPYASFWQDDAPQIVDGYRYLLGGTVSQAPVEGLGLVTKDFYWAPLQGAGGSLDLRSGLLNLKYSFGRLLYEEMAKIPNIQQEIQSLNLPQDMTQFYLNKVSTALHALSTGNTKLLEDSMLNVLSIPFHPENTEFKRPNIGIPPEFDRIVGEALSPDMLVVSNPILLEPDTISLDIPSIVPESTTVTVTQGSGNSPRGWLIGGGGLVLLLLLLSLGGGGGDSSSGQPSVPVGNAVGTIPPDVISPPTPGGCGLPSDSTIVTEIPCIPPVIYPPGGKVDRVPEPSTITPFVLLMALVLINYRSFK